MAIKKIKPIPPENAMNAVVYARYSSSNQTENSIDAQVRAAHEYAERKGFRIIGEYIDRAISGTTDNRPGFQRMIADAKKQQFAFVIVYRFDRFSRNRFDSAIYKKQLEAYGVRVLSTEESIGTGDEGIILESIYEAMAEAYSRRLSKIVTRGMRETALKGLSTGGNIPFGYRIEDHRLVIDEKNESAARFVFEAYAGGKSKTEIAKSLNEQGYRTRKGNAFTIQSITRILENPCYRGEAGFADIKKEVPAIVSDELFSSVQKALAANKKSYGKKSKDIIYELSGKLFCGYCGTAMVGDSGTSRRGVVHAYYSCGKRKKTRNCKKKTERKDFLEWYVCEQTVQFVLTDANIETIANRIMALIQKETGEDRQKTLEKQIAQTDKEFDGLVDSLIRTTNPIAVKKINEKIDELDNRLTAMRSELAEIRLQNEAAVTKEMITEYLKSFRCGDLMDENFRRSVIKTLVNCVYLFDDKVVIYFNLNDIEHVSFIEMLDDLDTMSEADGSDSLSCRPPLEYLSEPTRLIMRGKRIGVKISRD